MEQHISPVTPMNSIPADIQEMLGPPPLLSTEDEKLYFAFVAKLAQPIPSPDIITWMLIKDLADHRFEIARYRRLKSRLIQRAAEQGRARGRSLLPDAERPELSESRMRSIAALEVAQRGIYGNDPRFEELVDQEFREMEEREAQAKSHSAMVDKMNSEHKKEVLKHRQQASMSLEERIKYYEERHQQQSDGVEDPPCRFLVDPLLHGCLLLHIGGPEEVKTP